MDCVVGVDPKSEKELDLDNCSGPVFFTLTAILFLSVFKGLPT